ncbi:MAG: hypothetical protein KG029_11210 [Bacteroidetes bacterium]|nr:hypothetical protein [Bacteroidota bacterium]
MFNFTDSPKIDGTHWPLAAYFNEYEAALQKLAMTGMLADFANAEILTADRALTDDDRPIQRFTPSGADRAVTFPTPGTGNHPFFLVNAGDSYDLLLPSPHAPIGPGGNALIVGDGTAWNVVSGSGGGSNKWTALAHIWTRTGNHSFTVPGDVTEFYTPGLKVRYKDGGGYEYGVIAKSDYSAPYTTVTLIANSDYAMAAATITDSAISSDSMPDGFPVRFNFVPDWSLSNLTVGDATISAWWLTMGRNFYHYIDLVWGASTSASGSGALRYKLPIISTVYSAQYALGIARLRDASPATSYQGAVVYTPLGIDECFILALNLSGSYLAQANILNTVPFTWVAGDSFQVGGWMVF